MKLTLEDARRVLTTVHGFDDLAQGEKGVERVAGRLRCIQVDPINTAGRNHDLTLFSRVRDHRPEYLESLLYDHKKFFEYYCKMLSILSMETYPVFRWEMDRQEKRHERFLKEHGNEVDHIMKVLEEKPVSSLELKDMGLNSADSWRTSSVSNQLLRVLWLTGRICIAHRKGGRKYYTPAENMVPGDVIGSTVPEQEVKERTAEIIVKASRLVSPNKAPAQWDPVGGVREVRDVLERLERKGKIFSLELEGWKGKLYAHTEDADAWEDHSEHDGPFVRFLAPLDPLIWNRDLFAHIYGHEYLWEVYKKKEDRRYGYYCLPVLFNGEYVGIMEPYLHREGNFLEIKSFYPLKKDMDKGFRDAFDAELERYMAFLDTKEVKFHVENSIKTLKHFT